MRLALLVCLLLGVTAVCAYTIDYDIDGYDVDYDGFTTMGGRNRGYGGAALVLQPIVQRYQAPAVVQQKKQPIQLQLQQPVVQWQQPVVQQEKKAVRYAQPIVTYAQPIVQAMDMTPPKVEKKQMTAEAIYQADYRTAPVQQVQAITAQAPVIRKGFNAGQLNQNLGYGF